MRGGGGRGDGVRGGRERPKVTQGSHQDRFSGRAAAGAKFMKFTVWSDWTGARKQTKQTPCVVEIRRARGDAAREVHEVEGVAEETIPRGGWFAPFDCLAGAHDKLGPWPRRGGAKGLGAGGQGSHAAEPDSRFPIWQAKNSRFVPIALFVAIKQSNGRQRAGTKRAPKPRMMNN